ncbi:hypothetical protein [Bifidobacterium canis]|uniref:Membrane associated protein n=1 Tax=Bifidobacterium canis TaxID=2610880 RepID=A0A7K1J2M4_9BIFI|nr:hypothetical protein [Bifidobacterium canis]MUH58887.1 hypothetical protein [Bifidobacterium canis]
MTDLNNSNDGEEKKQKSSHQHDSDTPALSEEQAWDRFLDEYSEDLQDVEKSRTAKKFDKHAAKQEKKAMLSVDDLKQDSFVNASGPRDFTNSSWLDTDDVMDRGSVFTPPNPDLGKIRWSRLVCGILLVVGVVGVIATTFLPAYATVLGVIFGICVLVGAGGLFVTHRGHDETKTSEEDDGARV